MSKKVRGFQNRILTIEKKYGRIAKSNFVIADWIMKAKRFETIFKKKGQRKKLNYIYNHKHKAIEEMLKTGMLEVEICKPNDNEFVWLYVLTQELEGLKLTLVVPYLAFRTLIGIDAKELQLTGEHKDRVELDGLDISYLLVDKTFSYEFIMENLNKSRVKLIDKLGGN